MCGCLQLWRRYLTNTKVSFLENDADCAKKHKGEIEAVAKGRLFVGGMLPLRFWASTAADSSHTLTNFNTDVSQ